MLATAVSGIFADGLDRNDAFLERAHQMFVARNYQGSLDQLNYILDTQSSTLTDLQLSDATWLRATSLLQSGYIDEARRAYSAWLSDNFASPRRVACLVALADCDFYQGRYREAVSAYAHIRAAALEPSLRAEMDYRMAFGNMMLGDLEAAKSGFARLSQWSEYHSARYFYQGYIAYLEGNYDEARSLMQQANPTTTPGRDARYYVTQMEYSQGNYDLALSEAEASLNAPTPYRAEMMRIAGESACRTGQKDKGYTYLAEYVGMTDSPKASALYLLGEQAYANGQWRRTIELMTPATEEYDDAMGQSAYLYTGQALLEEGDRDTALLAFDRAARMTADPKVAETALYNYISTRLEGGRTPFGSTTGLCEEFLSKYPSSIYASRVREYLVTGYMTDDNYEKALQSLNNMRNPSPALLAARQRVLFTLGSRDVASGMYKRALQRLTEARSLADGNAAKTAQCDLWIGETDYRLGDNEAAVKSLDAYLKYDRDDTYNRTIARYYRGYAQFEMKQYATARSDFEQVVKNDQAGTALHADAYNRIGDCRYQSREFAAAGDSYDKALSLNPESGDYPMYQKAMMSGLARDYSGKISLLDKMMMTYPTSGMIAQAMLEKAESQIALDQTDNALSTYRQLVKKYPSTRPGRNGALQMAITLMSAGRRGDAIKAYKSVIKNYPTSQEAAVASDDLKRILADDGKLKEYVAFINSVPSAPKLEASEMDALTFASAEKAYLANGSTDRLAEYVNEYPDGDKQPQALGYLASSMYESEQYDRAYSYASALVSRYPDAEETEEALAIKGDIEWMNGRGEEALASFTALAERASASRNVLIARLGIMRVSRDLGRDDKVLEMADAILASSTGGNAQRNEVVYSRALALYNTGKTDEATKAWNSLADDLNDLYGVQAAYHVARIQYEAGQYKQARRSLQKIIDSNTPHQYWLARAYVLLSDVFRSQGNTFEANEYLKSLRDNYPGTETDIFEMIDERLGNQQ